MSLNRSKSCFSKICLLGSTFLVCSIAAGDPSQPAAPFGVFSNSPGEYTGAANPPTLGSSWIKRNDHSIYGRCTAYSSSEDAIGYPCNHITIELYSDEHTLVTSVLTDNKGWFQIPVNPKRSYILKIKTDSYEIRKSFNPEVKVGEVLLQIQKK